MPHPDGGNNRGNYFGPVHSFDEAFRYVEGEIMFLSTTDHPIRAERALGADGKIRLIKFTGKHHEHGYDVVHGTVCAVCWGYRKNCSGTRIGHCTEPLDREIH